MGARLRSWWQKVRKPLEVAVIVALALGLIVMVTVIRGVNLSKANLSKANLRESLLYRAHLNDADLQGAYLDEAHLTRANLKDATGITIEELEKKGKSLKDTIMPDGSKHS